MLKGFIVKAKIERKKYRISNKKESKKYVIQQWTGKTTTEYYITA